MEITIGNMTDQRQAVSGLPLDVAAGGARGGQRELVRPAGVDDPAGRRPSWCPTSNAVEALREVKDEAEIARMERAAAIADAALYEVLPMMSEEVTEEQFALELDTAMRRGGAESMAFETIVAAGENSAKPHHRPGGRRVRQGDAVVVDFGATYEGYRSDMTRTFCVGAEPEGDMARVFAVVGASQAAGAAAVRPGIVAKEVDDVCRAIITDAGWADRFEHGTGHGVGSTSTRHRRSANWALLRWLPASSSPSSPVSTSPAKVASVSRTPWW